MEQTEYALVNALRIRARECASAGFITLAGTLNMAASRLLTLERENIELRKIVRKFGFEGNENTLQRLTELNGRLAKLLEDPQPGLASWNQMLEDVMSDPLIPLIRGY